MILSYEEFFNDVWDYVSEHIVDDDLWKTYENQFYEITFDFYGMYSKTTYYVQEEEIQVLKEPLSPKICARLIESFIKNFKGSINC